MSDKFINWDDDIIIDGNCLPADRLDRAKYAEFLTGMLASQGYFNAPDGTQKKRNYVLNLNSEWGSGKTYFLRRWENSLKGRYPVVYIDAWKQDYSDDPLVTVITSIITQLREQAGRDEKDPMFSVPSKVVGLLKAAAPGLVRGLAKRYLDIDPVAVMNAEDGNNLPEIPNPSDPSGEPVDMSIAASQMVKHLLDEHSAKEKAIESLKTSVKQWVEAVVGLSEGTITYPAFIFVDELDRCRPSYAVEMLETIKHIFDLDGVVFVVATDTEQLQHTIKALYGNDFGARTYLGRFFNSRYTLREPSYSKLLDAHCDVSKLTNEYLLDCKGVTGWPNNGFHDESGDGLQNLISVYEAMRLSARQVIQITERLIATFDSLPDGIFIDVIYLSFLLCLQEKHPHIFESSKTHSLGGFSGENSTTRQMDEELSTSSYWRSRMVTIHLNPRLHMPNISIDSRTTQENVWNEGYREVQLAQYIQICHAHVSSSSSSNAQLRSLALNNLAQASRNKSQFNPEGNVPDWLNVIYGDLNLKLGIGISFYADLVELASALDHLEDEE
ncbi:KAP family P-loop NTPase fold protein [Vibrio sp.]|uniref:KAP family P-loop NTPase fold protein n=1 Tax=Vibrio sp. TaxID=678 RepID=UPI003AA97BA5